MNLIVIIDFVDNTYHGTYFTDSREICSMKPRDGTISCHRYCTAFVLETKKPLTLAMTRRGRNQRRLLRPRPRQPVPFKINAILADRGYYQERVIRRARATTPVVLSVVKRANDSAIT